MDVEVPAILAAGEAEALASFLASRRSRSQRKTYTYPLGGRILSPHDGLSFGARMTDGRRYYHCPDKYRALRGPDRDSCDCVNLDARSVETFTFDALVEILADASTIEATMADQIATQGSIDDRHRARMDALRSNVLEAEEAMAGAYAAAVAEGISPGVATKMTKVFVTRYEDATDALASATKLRQAGMRARRSPDQMKRAIEVVRGVTRSLGLNDMQRLFEIVDLSVAVKGFMLCTTCHGTGRMSRPSSAPRTAGGSRRCDGPCLGFRQTPRLTIAGVMPEFIEHSGTVITMSEHRTGSFQADVQAA